MNIFVGNLLFESTETDVKKLFEGFGSVASVVIAMEKKAPKSRGFGFVQMPDEQQALAAIAALNGKEFMGRVLNVDPARPKVQKVMVRPPLAKAKAETHGKSELKKKMRPKFEARAKQHSPRETEQKKTWFSPVFNKHLRLRKRGDKPKPWQKSPGEHKSWEKPKEVARRPWKKTEGEAKPWKKAEGESKPWSKRSERPQKPRFKGQRKLSGYKR